MNFESACARAKTPSLKQNYREADCQTVSHDSACSGDEGGTVRRVNLRKDAKHRKYESGQNEEQGDYCPSAPNDIGSTHVEREASAQQKQ